MKHMIKLISPLAAVWLVLGCVVATELAPVAQSADAAKARVYLVGVPGAT